MKAQPQQSVTRDGCFSPLRSASCSQLLRQGLFLSFPVKKPPIFQRATLEQPARRACWVVSTGRGCWVVKARGRAAMSALTHLHYHARSHCANSDEGGAEQPNYRSWSRGLRQLLLFLNHQERLTLQYRWVDPKSLSDGRIYSVVQTIHSSSSSCSSSTTWSREPRVAAKNFPTPLRGPSRPMNNLSAFVHSVSAAPSTQLLLLLLLFPRQPSVETFALTGTADAGTGAAVAERLIELSPMR